jgi:hypothetical protein
MSFLASYCSGSMSVKVLPFPYSLSNPVKLRAGGFEARWTCGAEASRGLKPAPPLQR